MKKLTIGDINTIESDDGVSEDQYYVAIQRAINSGAWGLQGSYGRAMMAAIEGGYCLLGEARARDYWGSTVPARTDVKAGTKGSREFVVEAMGEPWAALTEGA